MLASNTSTGIQTVGDMMSCAPCVVETDHKHKLKILMYQNVPLVISPDIEVLNVRRSIGSNTNESAR